MESFAFTTEPHLPTAGREVIEKKSFCLSRGVFGTNKQLSRRTITIINQSITISIAINGVALILASTGGIGPVAGAIIHNIGSVIVVGNSSRLIGYRFRR